MHRRRPALLALTTLVTTCLVAVLAAPASAEKPQPPAPTDTVSTVAEVVIGGRTQSKDPTRYDYVAPVGRGGYGGVTPMSADGYAFLSAFTYSWQGLSIPVPGSYIYHRVAGSGLTVTEEEGTWMPMAATSFQMCNTQFQFQNRNGSTIYSTVKMSVESGCSVGYRSQTYTPDRTVKTGLLCARLFVNGTFRGEQCHNVYA